MNADPPVLACAHSAPHGPHTWAPGLPPHTPRHCPGNQAEPPTDHAGHTPPRVTREHIRPAEARRRAVVYLGEQMLAGLIELPAGLTVQGIHAVWDFNAVAVVVEGDQLAPQPEGNVLPALDEGLWSRLSMVDDDGVRWVRFAWTRDPADCPASEDDEHCAHWHGGEQPCCRCRQMRPTP